jgi:hypothetical protein
MMENIFCNLQESIDNLESWPILWQFGCPPWTTQGSIAATAR